MDELELREILKPIFVKFDRDNSGFISTAELSDAVKSVGADLTEEQVEAMMEDADPNGTGDIDLDEFVAAFKVQLEQGGADGFLESLVKAHRAGGRGGLVIEEEEKQAASYDEHGLKRFIGDLPGQLVEIMKKHHARVLEIFNTLDEDGSGKITGAEFVRVVKMLGVASAASDNDVRRSGCLSLTQKPASPPSPLMKKHTALARRLQLGRRVVQGNASRAAAAS